MFCKTVGQSRRSCFRIEPRYTVGSPSWGESKTAEEAARREREMYDTIIRGKESRDLRERAERLGLSGIVQEQRQMEDFLVVNLAIRGPQRSGVMLESRSGFNGLQGVFVDRVAVVLVELQQATDVCEFGNDPFQNAGVVHAPQHGAEMVPTSENGQKDSGQFRRRRSWQ